MTDEQLPAPLEVPAEMVVAQMQGQLTQALTEIAALRALVLLRDAEIARLTADAGPSD